MSPVPRLRTLWRAPVLALVSLPIAAGMLVPVWAAPAAPAASASTPGIIKAIGTENEYADVLSQIGGKYVQVSSILDNPNTDPHTFEASPSVAQEVSAASLIVQNGVGYDTFMNKIESATPNSAAQGASWSSTFSACPTTRPTPTFGTRPRRCRRSPRPWRRELSTIPAVPCVLLRGPAGAVRHVARSLDVRHRAFKAKYAGTTVATTEPVADYLLTAMGLHNLTPFRFQADIMSGVDPAPQDITLEDGFFTKHQVKVFCYNQQVVSSLTSSIRLTAQHAGVPVVGVYETMPDPRIRLPDLDAGRGEGDPGGHHPQGLHRAPVIDSTAPAAPGVVGDRAGAPGRARAGRARRADDPRRRQLRHRRR